MTDIEQTNSASRSIEQAFHSGNNVYNDDRLTWNTPLRIPLQLHTSNERYSPWGSPASISSNNRAWSLPHGTQLELSRASPRNTDQEVSYLHRCLSGKKSGIYDRINLQRVSKLTEPHLSSLSPETCSHRKHSITDHHLHVSPRALLQTNLPHQFPQIATTQLLRSVPHRATERTKKLRKKSQRRGRGWIDCCSEMAGNFVGGGGGGIGR